MNQIKNFVGRRKGTVHNTESIKNKLKKKVEDKAKKAVKVAVKKADKAEKAVKKAANDGKRQFFPDLNLIKRFREKKKYGKPTLEDNFNVRIEYAYPEYFTFKLKNLNMSHGKNI